MQILTIFSLHFKRFIEHHMVCKSPLEAVSLLISCVLLLSDTERRVLMAADICGFVYFSSQFDSLASCVLKLLLGPCTFRIIISFLMNWAFFFFIMECPSLSLLIVLLLKSMLSDINAVVSAFFQLVLTWYEGFSIKKFFNLSVPLYLRWVSCWWVFLWSGRSFKKFNDSLPF